VTEEVLTLLHEVVRRLEASIQARDCPAMVALRGDRKLVLSDYDYLRDEASAAAFERRAAAHAREVGATRWVFAVPLVWLICGDVVSARAVSNLPLRPGEQEVISWMSFDLDEGVDYGRVAYTRRPNGDPVFDEPEVFTTEVRPAAGGPGSTLLHAFMEANGPTADGRG
jgi:hypothetical protein